MFWILEIWPESRRRKSRKKKERGGRELGLLGRWDNREAIKAKDSKEREKKNLWQLARLRDRVENDGRLVMVIKDGDGNVLASIESVMKRRIKYLEDLMNEKKRKERRWDAMEIVNQEV